MIFSQNEDSEGRFSKKRKRTERVAQGKNSKDNFFKKRKITGDEKDFKVIVCYYCDEFGYKKFDCLKLQNVSDKQLKNVKAPL